MEKIIAMIGCAVSLASIAVAIASYRYSRAKGAQKADETEMLRAPLLWGIGYKPTGHEKNRFLEGQDITPGFRAFSLDRRTVLMQGEKEKGLSKYSLYFNTVQSREETSVVKMIAEGTLKLKNLGYDMTSYEIERITIELANKMKFDLQPELKMGIPAHNELHMADSEVEIFMSFLFCKDGQFSMFDYEQAKKGWGVLEDINLINTYIPDALYCNKWREITVIGITSNIHNERYRQDIRWTIKDGVITTSSHLLERVKEK